MKITAEQREAMRRNGRRGAQRLKEQGFYSSEAQSKRRRKQMALEVAEAKRLEAEGYEVYSPTVVCDRIAVKDGKVYFVDFKKPGQQLRPGQQRIHDLVPEMYIIQYEKNGRGVEQPG